MLQRHSPFLKLQDYFDCFADTTAADELQKVPQEPDQEEAAIKWLALAILHGLSCRSDAIELTRSSSGEVRAEMSGGTLTPPDRELAPRVFEAVRRIAHLDGDQEGTPLAIGIRNDSLECRVEVRRTPKGETFLIRLPNVGTA